MKLTKAEVAKLVVLCTSAITNALEALLDGDTATPATPKKPSAKKPSAKKPSAKPKSDKPKREAQPKNYEVSFPNHPDRDAVLVSRKSVENTLTNMLGSAAKVASALAELDETGVYEGTYKTFTYVGE